MALIKDCSEKTISRIAKEAGVSPSVVSSVLGGVKSSVRYSSATKSKVLEIASVMNYQMRAANTIGLIHLSTLYEPEDGRWVHWIAPLMSSIFLEGLKSDKLISVFAYSLKQLDEQLKSDNLPLIFKRRKIDGLIITGTYSEKLVDYLNSVKMPWVLMNVMDSHNHNSNSICFDEIFTGIQATKYLLNKGCKKILYAGVKTQKVHYSEIQRLQGFQLAMGESSAASDQIYIQHDDYDGFRKKLEQLLAKPDRPDAIFAYNERTALLCYRTITSLGLSLKDVRLITVAWFEKETCELLDIPYVELPAREIGKRAFELLIKRVSDQENIPGTLLRGEIRE